MKQFSFKTIVAIAAIASVTLLASCKKEEQSATRQHRFSASMEQCDSKTVLNGLNLEWTNDDNIVIIDANQNYAYYQAIPQSNATWANFTCYYGDDEAVNTPPYYAIYPGESVAYFGCATLPATQATVAGELTEFPMYAASENEVFQFKNLCGVLKLHLTKANVSINSISITAATPINGYFSIDNSGEAPTLSLYSEGRNTTVLTCSTAQDITSGHDFYIYLPAGSYSGLQITLGTDDGRFCTKTANTAIVVERSKITNITLGESNLAFTQGATIILTTDDVWEDGSGYQMLLDPTATVWSTILNNSSYSPYVGYALDCGDPYRVYSHFPYKIPTNADPDCSTQNMVCASSASIIIPAGTYDFVITNPTPDDMIWFASSGGNIGGRVDDYTFESGYTYEFYVYYGGGNDATDVTITGGAKGSVHKPAKTNKPTGNTISRTK